MVANFAVCLFLSGIKREKKETLDLLRWFQKIRKRVTQKIGTLELAFFYANNLFSNVIRPLSTRLIKPDFHVFNV